MGITPIMKLWDGPRIPSVTGPSSACLGRRNLVGMMGVMMSSGNTEEEMYKELFLGTVGRSLSTNLTDSNLTSVGSYAFYDCFSLGDINLPNAVSVGDYAFAQSVRRIYSSMHSVILPRCETLGSYAFYFKGRDTLNGSNASISIPSIKTIGDACFQYSGFAEIDIGASIESIGVRAFAAPEIVGTQKITIRSSSAPSFGANVFAANTGANLIFMNLDRTQVEAISGYPFGIKKFKSSDDEWTLT